MTVYINLLVRISNECGQCEIHSIIRITLHMKSIVLIGDTLPYTISLVALFRDRYKITHPPP